MKLDGHSYNATILHRILHMAGVVSSFDVAAVALSVVGEIVISDRQINKLTTEVVGFSRHPVCHQLQLVGAAAQHTSRSRLQPGFSIWVQPFAGNLSVRVERCLKT